MIRFDITKSTRKKKEAIISKLKALLANDKRVQTAWLFGSITNHTTIKDVDVAVHTLPELSFAEFLDFNAHIEVKLGLPVDILEITKAPVSLKQKIIREGILIKGSKNSFDE